MQPTDSTSTHKNRGKTIGGVIFGILLIAVVVYKYVSETKKVSDTEENLKSIGLLPKDSDTAGKSNTSDNPGTTRKPISIIKDEIFILAMKDDAQLKVYPSFTILNAKNVLCHATLYFYDDEGNNLKTGNRSEYTNSEGIIFSSLDFQPQQDQVKYSSSHSDLELSIPYSKLYLPPGTDHVQYDLLLYDNNGALLEKSERLSLKIELPTEEN